MDGRLRITLVLLGIVLKAYTNYVSLLKSVLSNPTIFIIVVFEIS